MRWMKKSRANERVESISVMAIVPNPAQPRQSFEEGALAALSDSIRRYGILQPLSVRKKGERYELIAGERRLRAAILAGCREVPCLVYEVEEGKSAELAIVENLLRENLNMFEVALAMERLAREYALTQEEIAEKLSVSQSQVANKLRLLRLPIPIRERILAEGLTERHARALLRLEPALWESTLSKIIEKRLNVSESEALIDKLLETGEGKGTSRRRRQRLRGSMRDLRLFYNSVEKAVDMVRRCGVSVESRREEEEKEIRYIISIAK